MKQKIYGDDFAPKIELINRTDVTDTNIMKIVNKLCEGNGLPDFYLICQTPEHRGVTITNLDRPCVIITVTTPEQFTETLHHELIHLKQHALDYASEEEVELIVTDKYKTMNELKRCAEPPKPG